MEIESSLLLHRAFIWCILNLELWLYFSGLPLEIWKACFCTFSFFRSSRATREQLLLLIQHKYCTTTLSYWTIIYLQTWRPSLPCPFFSPPSLPFRLVLVTVMTRATSVLATLGCLDLPLIVPTRKPLPTPWPVCNQINVLKTAIQRTVKRTGSLSNPITITARLIVCRL